MIGSSLAVGSWYIDFDPELLEASLMQFTLDYDAGERYPHLARVAERADLLTPILAPRTP